MALFYNIFVSVVLNYLRLWRRWCCCNPAMSLWPWGKWRVSWSWTFPGGQSLMHRLFLLEKLIYQRGRMFYYTFFILSTLKEGEKNRSHRSCKICLLYIYIAGDRFCTPWWDLVFSPSLRDSQIKKCSIYIYMYMLSFCNSAALLLLFVCGKCDMFKMWVPSSWPNQQISIFNYLVFVKTLD